MAVRAAEAKVAVVAVAVMEAEVSEEEVRAECGALHDHWHTALDALEEALARRRHAGVAAVDQHGYLDEPAATAVALRLKDAEDDPPRDVEGDGVEPVEVIDKLLEFFIGKGVAHRL